MTDLPPYLAPHHAQSLEAIGVGPLVQRARGYFTATRPEELAALSPHPFAPAQAALVPALVIPTIGVDGDVVLHQIRPDDPRLNEKGKPLKYETPAHAPLRLDVAPATRHLLDNPKEELWITEGVKKADAASVRGLCCLSLLGVWGFVGRNEHGAKVELSDWRRVALTGRDVFVAFDSDVMVKPAVRRALVELAAMLDRRGAKRVLPVVIPADDGDKVGMDDWFARGGTVDELRRSVRRDLLRTDGRIEIGLNNRELRDVTADAVEALAAHNDPPRIFVRDGKLARIEWREPEGEERHGRYTISPLKVGTLRNELALAADWVRVSRQDGSKKVSHAFAPKDVAENVLAMGDPPEGFPMLRGLSSAPVVGPEGRFHKAHGYDPSSRWYVTDSVRWHAWEGRDGCEADGAGAAAWVLRELFVDFPFKDRASRANAMGLFILPFVKPIVHGPTPMHFADAARSGTGKGLLIDAALMPALGKRVDINGLPDDEKERDKLLYSVLSQGDQVVLFDNFKGYLNSVAVERCLTGTNYTSRVLGLSSAPPVRIDAIFALTANNARLSPDMARRCLWMRLESANEDPEHRSDLRHPDLRAWIRANRATLVACAMAMVEEWVRAGRPPGPRRKSSFEDWSAIVGGVLECCGVEGFLANDRELKAATSDEDEAWRPFYQAWFDRFGLDPATTEELRQMAKDKEMVEGVFAKAKSERGEATAFGRALNAREGTVLNVRNRDGTQVAVCSRKFTMSAGKPRFKLAPPGELVNFSLESTEEISEDLFREAEKAGDEVHQFTKQVQNAPETGELSAGPTDEVAL